MTGSIHDEMLSDMPAMRMALGRHFKWYYHITPLTNVPSIRAQGLLPRPDKAASEVVVKYIGPSASKIICLNPLGANVVPPTVQQGPFVCLAICRESLPRRVGLDWSYDGGFGIAEVLRAEDGGRSAACIFVESAKRWGSILSYDAIPKEALRVYVHGCMPHDPKLWPMLTAGSDHIFQTI
jgi:hypothetical protein